MEKPTSITFTDFEVPIVDLFRRVSQGPMHLDWTRVQFTIPDPHEACKAVEAWLVAHCPGDWESYSYQSPRGKTSDFIMVVRFKNRDDALMFKLRGGHQAFENT